MQGRNPGVWIAAAVIFAVLVFAIGVPRRSTAPPSPSATERDAKARPTAVKPIPATPSAPAPEGLPPPVIAPGPSGPTLAPDPATPPPVLPGGPAPAEENPVVIERAAARQAVDNVHFALRDFRAALGGNPEGTNAEITSALMGRNLKQLRMDLPEGSRLSADGELCDPWGTPYFFHQLSAQKMEIRSAGPDRKMWTGDDIEM